MVSGDYSLVGWLSWQWLTRKAFFKTLAEVGMDSQKEEPQKEEIFSGVKKKSHGWLWQAIRPLEGEENRESSGWMWQI